MNQYHDLHDFHLYPDASRTALETTLARLLVPGDLTDSRLKAHCRRLQERFDLFSSTCPAPRWHQGLIITPEIRCQTEIYLPVAEIQRAFRYLLLRSCRYSPFLAAAPIFSALSWADAVERIRPHPFTFNPARLIATITTDQDLRRRFLASLFVPKRYGGGLDRYPLQKMFLKNWLIKRATLKLSLLDAACGSGEGLYEIAQFALQSGMESLTLHGCTVEPLELAAAAHGWFPHDLQRGASHRKMIEKVSGHRWQGAVEFFREDICREADSKILYDVVICNGLLGGPLLHEKSALEAAVSGLAQRIKKGGIILAADRFHGGWRRVTPLAGIQRLFEKQGMRPIDLPEGIGAIRSG